MSSVMQFFHLLMPFLWLIGRPDGSVRITNAEGGRVRTTIFRPPWLADSLGGAPDEMKVAAGWSGSRFTLDRVTCCYLARVEPGMAYSSPLDFCYKGGEIVVALFGISQRNVYLEDSAYGVCGTGVPGVGWCWWDTLSSKFCVRGV